MRKIQSYFTDAYEQFRLLGPTQRKSLLFLILSLFAALFSYPLIRSTVDALFLDSYGGHKSPHVWIFSVITLAFVVALFNSWQEKYSIHKLFLLTSIASFGYFLLCIHMINQGHKIWAYPLFVGKEVYIILLVHMGIGFLNSSVDIKFAKVFYGPIGAINGLAGFVSGVLTSYLTYHLDISWIFMLGCVALLLSGIFFWNTDRANRIAAQREGHKLTPIESIYDVKKYVLLILVIVAISQFSISVASLKFNILFTDLVPSKIHKVRYLGVIYSIISFLSMFLQFIMVPIALRLYKIRSIHFFIPCFYFLVTIFCFGLGWGGLIPISMGLIFYKGLDYSLFSTAKELLYFPLNKRQKYGAKYLADFIVYRFAKGIISFVLIFIQTTFFLNSILMLFLTTWIGIVYWLFKVQKNTFTSGGDINESPIE